MVPWEVASRLAVCHGSSNLLPGPEHRAHLASILSWCSTALQSICTPVVGRLLVATCLLDLSMVFEAFLPELIERTVRYRSNPLMGLQPPSEPFQETPSRRIANPVDLAGSRILSWGFFPFGTCQRIELSQAASTPLQGPRAGFGHPLREHLLSPPTDHFSGQSAHGIAALQGIDRLVLRLDTPLGGPCSLAVSTRLLFPRTVRGFGEPPCREECEPRPQSLRPEDPAHLVRPRRPRR